MTEHPSDHLGIYAAEAAGLVPDGWDVWIDQVEQLIGHSADGDVHEDGYSLDSFHAMFKAGLTPEQASIRIRKSVFVVPGTGTVYRLSRAGSGAFEPYTETYSVLTPEGYQSVAYELPPDARLVWAPDQAVDECAGQPT